LPLPAPPALAPPPPRRDHHLAQLVSSRALVRELAPSFAADALRRSAPGAPPIDQALAALQHARYVEALGAALALAPASAAAAPAAARGVTLVPHAPGCADSVFIEDTAVVVGGTALVTRPGHPARRGETAGVRLALEAAGLRVVEAAAPARLDGGDVLFTGREFFVGLSRRSNAAGCEALGRAFPGLRVTAVPLARLLPRQQVSKKGRASGVGVGAARADAALHLKSVCSLLGPDTLAVADSELGRALAFFLQDSSGVPRAARLAGRRLAFVLVPDEGAANVLFVNGAVLHQPRARFPRSLEALDDFARAAGVSLVEVDTSELAKADGALSCCSILF
jgi:dimethylargininase